MTAIELEAKKLQLLREIDSEELLIKMQKYLHRIKRKDIKLPCQFSLEEKEVILLKGEQDARDNLGTLHEDMEKEFTLW